MTKPSYYYQDHYPNCYSFHRPDGTDIAFLQGDDAREFDEILEGVKLVLLLNTLFEDHDQLLSAIIEQYDC